jgi:hypothetical protein
MWQVSVPLLMKPPTNNHDADKLAWFIDLLNEGRSPEPSVADRRKPADKKKLVKKNIEDLVKESPDLLVPSPKGLRAEIGGLTRTVVNLLLGFNGSSEALRHANRITKQSWSSPQFVMDRSGKLRVYRTARPEAGVRAPLLIDAMGVLSYLVERGLLSRLKRCPGYRSPQYRAEARGRCGVWFDGASNKTYHSPACRQNAEHVRNKERYNVRQAELMREIRKKEQDEKIKHFAKEKRAEWRLRGGAGESSKRKVKVP